MRIFAVDPGSRLTGYGCIDLQGSQLKHVAHGTLRLLNAVATAVKKKSVLAFEDRLLAVFHEVSRLIVEYRPHILVVERVFFAKNAVSALKLGQVRGVILVVGKLHHLKIAEYSPTEVKSAVAGHGHADKQQVSNMVQRVLGKQVFETADASDSLALAICHARMQREK